MDIKKIIKGQIFFIFAIFFTLILNTIMNGTDGDGLISNLSSAFNSTAFEQIANFMLITIVLLLIIVIPIAMILSGIIEVDPIKEKGNPIINIVVAIFLFIFQVLLTIKGYFIIEEIAGIIESPFILILFWIGFVSIWLLSVIVAPIYSIILNKQEN